MIELRSPFHVENETPPDPIRAAREPRQTGPKRFWREAAVAPGESGLALLLDGKPARTPARRPLIAPTPEAAAALAAEWNAVGETLDPAAMPLTRLINAALDGVAGREAAVWADIVKYARSDLLCYRAADPERLAETQTALWDPILRWAREELGALFSLAEGVMFIEQPAESIAAVERAVASIPAPHALAALHSATTLTGSAILALALARGGLTAEEAWRAAHVDEDVQMAIWGADEEALERRARRRLEFDAAALLLRA